jgi:15-cis-phytoene synthase
VRTLAELTPLYQEAARHTAHHSKSFYFATRFFPSQLARSAHAVYWFCRYTDDLVDECPSIDEGRRDLENWDRDVRRALRDGTSAQPVLTLFLDAVHRHRIPHEYPLDLIEGMRMDLDGVRYPRFADLRVFCYRVASVVGLMMSHVIGFREPAPAYAIDLGIAMQLTNILRDVAEDLDRGRLYLPTAELERFGCSEESLRARRVDDAFRALMRFQVARARDYYAAAEPGIALLDPSGRFAVKVALDVYRAILDRIEAMDYNVFAGRAVVPPLRKYWLSARSLAAPAARYSVQRLAFWRSGL